MRQVRAFTLLEVMVVLAIIGSLLAMVSITGSSRQAEDETTRLGQQLITLFSAYQQEAVFQNLDLGLAFQDQQLLLLNLQDIRKEENNANKSREELDALVKNPWQPYSGHLKKRLEIPEYIEVLLSVEGTEIDLYQPTPEHGPKPVLVFLSSDEYSHFKLTLSHDDDPSFMVVLEGDGFNPPKLTLEYFYE